MSPKLAPLLSTHLSFSLAYGFLCSDRMSFMLPLNTPYHPLLMFQRPTLSSLVRTRISEPPALGIKVSPGRWLPSP